MAQCCVSPVDTYEQTVTVEFCSPKSARRASVRLAGLYHDHKAALSTRMDDNNVNDVRVAEVMARFGQRGTFFLNDPWTWWEDNATIGAAMLPEPGAQVPRSLVAGGHSIGAHTLSHDYLPALSKNAAFREILGSRIALEVHAGTPVSTFTYPFMNFRSALREGLDRADLEEMLRRSGVVQLAEDGYDGGRDLGPPDAHFIAVDGQTVRGGMGEAVVERECRGDKRPLLLVSMHAWPGRWGGIGFPKLEGIYRHWSGRPDWWYCNVNEYAAYRYQALHTALSSSIEGRSVKVLLARPNPLDLGDWVPLTLVVDGVSPGEVLGASCAGSEVKPSGVPGVCAFDLGHDRGLGPIGAFCRSLNPENSEQVGDAPTVAQAKALLHRGSNHLALLLRNEGERPLRDIRATFRLPLRWSEGIVRRHVESLEPGGALTLRVDLAERPDTDGYADGVEFDVAQLDFVGERRVRLYAVCEAHREEPPAHFSRRGFLALGPIPGDLAELDPQVFGEGFPGESRGGRVYTVPWGRSLCWRAPEAMAAGFLDPDIIPTAAQANTLDIHAWHSSAHHPCTRMSYILRGTIVSPEAMTVRAIFDHSRAVRLELNGAAVSEGELGLQKGRNDLRILYRSLLATESQFNESNYGCYFRLVDAEGRRVKGIRFATPDLA
jgi:peptidoglycan/xylan/chitin deacetylase (PgdA/CDA1 family)